MKEKILNYQFSVFNFSITPRMIIKHPLFSGSAVMFIGSNLANSLAYLYHLIVGRLLGPNLYGELAALISLITMFTVSFNFLGVVIVKFVSAAKKKDYEKILSWFFKKAIIFGVIIGGVGIAATPWISKFIHVDEKVVLLVGPILVFSIFVLVFRSFLQGLVRFGDVAILVNAEMFLRLSLGILFIKLGYSVFGAVFALFVAIIINVILGRLILRQYRIVGMSNVFDKGRSILKYTIPIFVCSLATNSIFSTDLLLVKHFFSSYDAGIYASMSTLGKIIFFGTAPVSAVMFPMISKRHSKGYGYKKIFFMSLGLVTLGSLSIVIIYYLIPEIMVKILYGEKFIAASSKLVWFGLFMAIFSVSSVFMSYFLSREKTKVAYFVSVAAIIQIIGIWFFHSSITQVIAVSIIVATFLLISLALYFTHEFAKGKIK